MAILKVHECSSGSSPASCKITGEDYPSTSGVSLPPYGLKENRWAPCPKVETGHQVRWRCGLLQLLYSRVLQALRGGWVPRTCKWLGSPPIYKPWKDHLEGEQPYLGDVLSLTMIPNYLLNGMTLQVPSTTCKRITLPWHKTLRGFHVQDFFVSESEKKTTPIHPPKNNMDTKLGFT